MSRTGPFSPASTRRAMSALCAASPPRSCSSVARGNPRSAGSRSCSVTAPRDTSQMWLCPVVESSSRPSSPRNTSAVAPRVWNTPTKSGTLSRCGDADGRRLGTGRVAQRSEEVEDGRDAELGAHRPGVPEAGVEERREREGDAGLLENLRDALRGDREVDAQRGQHIRGPRGGAGRLVAVLDDPSTRRRGDDRRHRRDVDRAESIASGADDVQRHRIDIQGERVREHRVAEADDLIDRLALGPQRDQERTELSGGRPPRHDLLHRPGGLGDREVGARQELGEQGWPAEFRRHGTIVATTGTRR